MSDSLGCGAGCGCAGGGARREPWRSLEELSGDDTAREFREREFPIGAAELPDDLDRRSFVQLLGASVSLAGLAACRRPVETIVPFVDPPETLVPGVPKRYATTMPWGLGGLGLVVESHEGRPTKIEGNELHPASRGATSALAQASILALYDPDRSRIPLERSTAGAEAPESHEDEAVGLAPHGFAARDWSAVAAVWQELEPAHLADGGARLAVLLPPSSSPTAFRLVTALRERFPRARVVAWEPVGDENALAGAERFAGRRLRPTLDVGAARVILSLDADLFGGECEAVSHARGFAAGRRAESTGDGMNRLWVVESALTSTGAMADHRIALPSAAVGPVARSVAAALAARGFATGVAAGAAGPAPNGLPERWLAALVDDLASRPGEGLVVAGRDQPAAVHELALRINHALGNVGTTIALREPVDLLLPQPDGLRALAAAMRGGAVSTLFVLGGNPAYDAAGDLDFASALDAVETVVHLGHRVDETAHHAHWHLPEAHYLEAWGDCRAADGTASVVQPLIAPLFDGRSRIELLALLATGAEANGHDLVRETWSALLPGDVSFERVLHDGLLAGTVSEPVEVDPAAPSAGLAAELGPSGDGGLELVFRASPAVHDGRFADVGWLQELPDALTKLTWGNAALVAPATASRLGLRNEDGVRLAVAGRPGVEVELPVWIVPGQAEETVVVHLGYGRRAAGRVGRGVGADVYPLRDSVRPGFSSGATLAASGTRHRIAQTQDHGSMEGRAIVREATLERWRHEPRFAAEAVEVPETTPLFEPHESEGPQWAMTVDLNACTGCNACVVACQSENNVPIVGHEQVRRGREMHWLRLDRYFTGSPEAPEVSFQPMPCMQCENAPCEQVCPVAATVHTEDGLNAMVYNRCIGTRYCSNNCPYKVRRFNFFNYTKDTPELLALAANPNVTVRSRGVMEKCTYCVQRIQAGKIDAKMAGRALADGDIRTACQQTCPTHAIVFGDLRDPASAVNERKRSERNYELLAELGNRPRTSFLARIRNPHPALAEA